MSWRQALRPSFWLTLIGAVTVLVGCAAAGPAQPEPYTPPRWFPTRHEVCDRHGNLLIYWGQSGLSGSGVVKDEADCNNIPEGSPPR